MAGVRSMLLAVSLLGLATSARAVTVAPGTTLTGQPFAWQSTFANRYDGTYDEYSIVLSTGFTYYLKTSNASGGSTDTFLYLTTTAGAVVAQDDDSNGSGGSRIQYPPTQAGTYLIKLRAFAKGTSGTCTLAVSTLRQNPAGTPKYPDLIVWKKAGAYMYDAEIIVSGTKKLLRFSSAPPNVGKGPLEMYGVQRPDGTALGYQRVYNTDGSFFDRLISTFTGQTKDALLFQEFYDQSLRVVTSTGGIGGLVATRLKTVFGMADDVAYDKTLPGAPAFGLYPNPNPGESVGWTDVYDKTTAGQEIDITSVSDGIYWLESRVNPKGLLKEGSVDNDTGRLKVQISGTSLAILGDDSGVGAPPPPPQPPIASLPAGFSRSVFAAGLAKPTAMAFAPDGRLFVLEQAGRVRVVKDGVLLPSPALSIPVYLTGEMGLLGIAFDPGFAANRYVYFYYTVSTAAADGGGYDRLSRFQVSASSPDLVDPASETYLIANIGLIPVRHNGGALHFGTDGMLYVAVGDHGSGANSQNLGNLAGKLLRLDPASYPNIIPADNPFVGQAGKRGEIWAYGLRNPYTFNIDPATGKLYINDVGEALYEEIDLGARGANYGWPTCEGPCSPPNAAMTDPVYFYGHSPACAISGGAFYRGSRFPAAYGGAYLFSDWCGNFVDVLRPDLSVSGFDSGLGAPVDDAVGPDGALYVLEYGAARVSRVSYSSATAGGGVPVFYDGFSAPDGLITNAYAFSHPSDPASVKSSTWDVEGGSLFANGGLGWSGAPDAVAPNATSSNGTGSAVFRMTTKRADFGDVAVSLSLLNLGLVTTSATPAAAGDGVSVLLRYRDANNTYYVSVNRRDNIAVVKKKIAGVYYTLGSAPNAVAFNTTQSYTATAKTNAGGSVTLQLLKGGAALLTVTDTGTGGAAFSAAGKTGLWGTNDNFKLDDFSVTSGTSSSPPPPPPPPGALLADGFSEPDGLVTNEYAFTNPTDAASVKSSTWLVTNGSLFASGSQGWTGVPDSVAPNATSSNGTGSATFRLVTQRSDLGDVAVSMTLTNLGLTSTSATPDENTDGVSLVLRYQSSQTFYLLTVNRRDNLVAIKKKVSGVYTTLASGSFATPFNVAQTIQGSVQTLGGGSVAIGLTVNGVALSVTDASSPISAAGKAGLWATNDQFKFDDFTVTAATTASGGATALGFRIPEPPVTPAAVAGVGPNPWRADQHHGLPMVFRGLASGTTVKLFTTSGRAVAVLNELGGAASWDVSRIRSGFYLYVITSPGKPVEKGRVAIIR